MPANIIRTEHIKTRERAMPEIKICWTVLFIAEIIVSDFCCVRICDEAKPVELCECIFLPFLRSAEKR